MSLKWLNLHPAKLLQKMTSTSNHIQYQIVKYIEENAERSLKDYSELSEVEKCYKVFDNFRLKNNIPQGLKLTRWGMTRLSKHFAVYEFTNDSLLNGKVLLKLDRVMKWPYYVSQNNIALFNSTDSAWFKLNGSNLADYLDTQ